MKILFRDYVEYRDNNPVLQEGLWDGIKNIWSGFKNWWSQKPSQTPVFNNMANKPKSLSDTEMVTDPELERKRKAKISADADEALSRLDKPLKDAALARDLKQRLVSSGVDPKVLSDDMLKGYVDEILSTTRQGGQRAMKIQQIIDSFKRKGGTQSSGSVSGSDGADMARKTLMQVSQAFGGKFPSKWKVNINIRKDGSVYISLIDPQGMSRNFGVNDADDMIHLIRSYRDDDDDEPNMQYNYVNRR